jgi:hypothetical protein
MWKQIGISTSVDQVEHSTGITQTFRGNVWAVTQ